MNKPKKQSVNVFKYSPDCEQCLSNKSKASMYKFVKINNNENDINTNITKLYNQEVDIRSEIETHDKTILKLTEAFQHHEAADLSLQLGEYEVIEKLLTTLVVHKNQGIWKRIQLLQRMIDQHKVLKNIAKKKPLEDEIKQLETEQETINKKIVIIKKKIREYELVKIRDINKKLTTVSTNIKRCKAKLMTLQDEYTTLHANNVSTQKAYDTYISEVNKHKNEASLYNLYKMYSFCLDQKNGAPASIMKLVKDSLVDSCNDFLDKITDFSIDMYFDSNGGYDIVTCSSTMGKKTYIPASMASGFQKFIIDLSIRVAVAEICSLTLPSILIVDEGFGCMDSDNMCKLRDILPQLSFTYDTILIISHLDKISSMADHIIGISTNDNGSSKVTIGQSIQYTNELLKKKLDIANKSEPRLQLALEQFNNQPMAKKISDTQWQCLKCHKVFKIRKGAIEKHMLSKSHA